MANTSIPFWKGTNFWFAALMVVGSFWGLQEGTANAVIAVGVAAVGAFGLVRQFLSTAKFGGFKEALLQPNTLNYLVSALTLAGVPGAAELVPAFKQLAEALISGNWGLAITASISFITILFYIFKKKPATA